MMKKILINPEMFNEPNIRTSSMVSPVYNRMVGWYHDPPLNVDIVF